ncbi:hypothetical protein BDM02DRAFT_3132452 [Thelephora ganbajun]|uniref:Uncharacterized protein n=1 Tax=Thelephora ganbajun TaxID=370292 RepID=A0ACB6Z1M7_THEGA|nr:hypothetical protein BDM02DRAFT_3132452 [Thelephora ganbajun]
MTGFIQAAGSIEDGSIGSISETSSQRGESLREGDLITGIIDLSNEHAHMVSAIRNEDHASQRKALETYLLSLQIIPGEYQDGWNLNHPSNKTWLSLLFHHHHDTYATILIAPSAQDSRNIELSLIRDNIKHFDCLTKGEGDPGRSQEIDWFENAVGEYELIILHPSHFLIGDFYVAIKHPTTKLLIPFYTSSDGFLHKGSPTGPRLPPFSSRAVVWKPGQALAHLPTSVITPLLKLQMKPPSPVHSLMGNIREVFQP